MGLVTAASSWRVAYALAALCVGMMAVMVARRVPRAASVTATRRTADHVGGLGRRGWLAVAGALTLMAASQCVFVTFGGWLEDSFDFTPAALSAVTFGLGLGELAASITSARRTDRWGKERSAALGAGLMVPSAIGLALWNDHLGIGLALLVVAVVGFEFAIVSTLAIASHLFAGSPARGLGLMIGAGTFGRALASIPATRLYANSGIGWPAAMTAALASITVVAMLLRDRRRDQPPAVLGRTLTT